MLFQTVLVTMKFTLPHYMEFIFILFSLKGWKISVGEIPSGEGGIKNSHSDMKVLMVQ